MGVKGNPEKDHPRRRTTLLRRVATLLLLIGCTGVAAWGAFQLHLRRQQNALLDDVSQFLDAGRAAWASGDVDKAREELEFAEQYAHRAIEHAEAHGWDPAHVQVDLDEATRRLAALRTGAACLADVQSAMDVVQGARSAGKTSAALEATHAAIARIDAHLSAAPVDDAYARLLSQRRGVLRTWEGELSPEQARADSLSRADQAFHRGMGAFQLLEESQTRRTKEAFQRMRQLAEEFLDLAAKADLRRETAIHWKTCVEGWERDVQDHAAAEENDARRERAFARVRSAFDASVAARAGKDADAARRAVSEALLVLQRYEDAEEGGDPHADQVAAWVNELTGWLRANPVVAAAPPSLAAPPPNEAAPQQPQPKEAALPQAREEGRLRDSVLYVRVLLDHGIAWGSAFLVNDRGYAITSRHLVTGAKGIRVGWEDSPQVRPEVHAMLVAWSHHEDLALLRLNDGEPFRALPFSARALQGGTHCLLVGFPPGGESGSEQLHPGLATNDGVISQADCGGDMSGLFETTEAAPSGSCGGPVLDAEDKGAIGMFFVGQGPWKGRNLGVLAKRIREEFPGAFDANGYGHAVEPPQEDAGGNLVCGVCRGLGEVCRECLGKGTLYTTCSKCGGSGNVMGTGTYVVGSRTDDAKLISQCSRCKGTGKHDEPCKRCNGVGRLPCKACGAVPVAPPPPPPPAPQQPPPQQPPPQQPPGK